MKNKIDIEEIERLKICKYNIELMERHVKRLEKAILDIDELLGQTKDLGVKIMLIANIIKKVKFYI